MSCNINGTQSGFDTQEEPTVTIPASVLKELIGMTIQLLSVLELHAPEEGHSLQVLADEEWVDWSILEQDLTEEMTEGLHSGGPIGPDQFKRIRNRDGWLAVHVEHIIDDFWWVECQPVAVDYSNQWKKDYGRGPAAATLRIEGSRDCLPYSAANSPRLTSSR